MRSKLPPAFDPVRLIGQEVDAMMSAWHDHDGVRGSDPIHVWLHWHELGWSRLHTPGSGDVAMCWDEPYGSYDMDECGSVIVEPGGPDIVTRVLGQRMRGIERLWQEPPGHHVGAVLDFAEMRIAVADVGDELGFARWPSVSWERRGISLAT